MKKFFLLNILFVLLFVNSSSSIGSYQGESKNIEKANSTADANINSIDVVNDFISAGRSTSDYMSSTYNLTASNVNVAMKKQSEKSLVAAPVKWGLFNKYSHEDVYKCGLYYETGISNVNLLEDSNTEPVHIHNYTSVDFTYTTEITFGADFQVEKGVGCGFGDFFKAGINSYIGLHYDKCFGSSINVNYNFLTEDETYYGHGDWGGSDKTCTYVMKNSGKYYIGLYSVPVFHEDNWWTGACHYTYDLFKFVTFIVGGWITVTEYSI